MSATVCFFLFSTLLNIAIADDPIAKVMTFNIRYGTANDGENHWKHRKQLVFDLIDERECDFIGIQEAIYTQLLELDQALPQHAYIGRTREADHQGEASPIFYRTDIWDLLEQGTFWLSENPGEEGSISWKAVLPRIATWGKFRHRQKDKVIYVYNTHYSHVSEQARVKSSQLILAHIGTNTGDTPVILMGDLNATEESMAISTFQKAMIDNYREINESAPGETFFGWNPHVIGTGKRIDYIFTSPNVDILNCTVIEQSVDGRYPSDHNPVVSKLQF